MPMYFFHYAYRNILRSRQRSLLTIGAMAFAGFIMIFYATLMEGLLWTTEQNVVGLDLGEIQIHAPGYRLDPDLYTSISNGDSVISRIEKMGFAAAPRLYAYGLAAAGSSSAGVRLRGVDLKAEPQVSRISRHLLAGQWLAGNDPKGVVLGRKLARTLSVKVGAEVVVVGQAADGSLANDLFQVRGILRAVGAGVDQAGFFMSIESFRKLMALPRGVHEIVVVRRNSADDLGQSTRNLSALYPDLEVLNWRQLQPVVARIVDISNYSLMIMLLITYAAVGILTLNAMLMSVFERIPELGVMKALGVSPWRIFGLILTEAMLQAGAAVALALATAVPLSAYFARHPLDFLWFIKETSSIAGVALEPVWYCRITPATIVGPAGFLFGMAVLAVLYPAGKAAVIRPLKAIYHR